MVMRANFLCKTRLKGAISVHTLCVLISYQVSLLDF